VALRCSLHTHVAGFGALSDSVFEISRSVLEVFPTTVLQMVSKIIEHFTKFYEIPEEWQFSWSSQESLLLVREARVKCMLHALETVNIKTGHLSKHVQVGKVMRALVQLDGSLATRSEYTNAWSKVVTTSWTCSVASEMEKHMLSWIIIPDCDLDKDTEADTADAQEDDKELPPRFMVGAKFLAASDDMVAITVNDILNYNCVSDCEDVLPPTDLIIFEKMFLQSELLKRSRRWCSC
jgi:hypothetical protein